MAVFRVERIKDYTVMSNHHLRNKNLSLKAKGLLSQMLSLPDDWDYTLKGLAAINKESVDAIRTAIWELEDTGYVVRTRVRDERGCLRGCDYYVYEYPQASSSGSDGSAESVPPMLEPLASDSAVQENPIQLNTEKGLPPADAEALFEKENSEYQFFILARILSLASSTFMRERIKVMMASSTKGITRYMSFSILMQDSGCTASALS